MKIFLAFAATVLAANLTLAASAPRTQADLRAEKLKALYRREPEAQQLVPKVEQALALMKADDPVVSQRSRFLENTIMQSSSFSGDRLHDAVENLSELAAPVQHFSADELAELRQRYAKLCSNIDDQIFVRDMESVLHLHDRFVRQTSLAVWDKQKVSSELKRLEEAYDAAPPIPYGRSELLRSLQGKRLSPPLKGCYVGVWPQEEVFLSTDRPSVGVLEESTGASVQLDTADMLVQDSDGKLYDLDACNRPVHGIPFSPPLSLWMKCRLLEGHVPAIQFRFLDSAISASGNFPKEVLGVQDVLSGKLDDYFNKNLKLIAEPKAAVLVGLFTDFDRGPAATAFGADGRTPYYVLVDPKLSKLPAERLMQEAEKRMSKGALTKDTGAELKKYYGDANLPDGPERVRDAWKHLHEICRANNANSISLYSCAGAYHGNKKALGQHPEAGAEDWNQLQYYWPGTGVIDWLASAAEGGDMRSDPGAIVDSIDQFMREVHSSNWGSLPIMLRGLRPSSKTDLFQEAGWIAVCFQQTLPQTYPDIKAFFIDFPERLSLHDSDAHGTFRRTVGSNSYYKPRLNLKDAAQKQAQVGK